MLQRFILLCALTAALPAPLRATERPATPAATTRSDRAEAPAAEPARRTAAAPNRPETAGPAAADSAHPETVEADTTIVVDRVQVTAIKQGMALRSEPVAATILGGLAAERRGVDALKGLGTLVPNLHMPDYGSRMTSSIYVRGMGTRIDHPVIGLNVDNVPLLNKNAFDTELADIERIEVLRGPQSTLYGRNTMGGVVNIYTRSPFSCEGLRLLAEFSEGGRRRYRASLYHRFGEQFGMAFTGFYTRADGFFRNEATDEHCDRERLWGGRWKTQWRNGRGLRIENTLSGSVGDEGGYPYAFVGGRAEALGDPRIVTGRIAYNDPSSYERTTIHDGLTIQYRTDRYVLSSITSYQFTDDDMHLDQDFLPLDYFTLQQALREQVVTEDLVFRTQGKGRYRSLFGLYGFYRHGRMHAPVAFKRAGVDALIFAAANAAAGGRVELAATADMPLESDFRNPNYGGALYHESTLRLGRFELKAGLRIDHERTRLHYESRGELHYSLRAGAMPHPVPQPAVTVEQTGRLSHAYTELLPKAALVWHFDENRNLYLSAARGYKAGGFNTQLFSDLLQEQLRAELQPGASPYDDRDRLSYRPEYSWNYEAGVHFSCAEGAIRGDAALFRIDCRDQQLTVFPDAASTGRMMTNAGRTRSTGAELSLQLRPWRSLEIDLAYGCTDARFRSYHDGKNDYAGRRIPYAPRRTASAGITWTIPTGAAWLGDLVLHGGLRGTGEICWNEANDLVQPFYTLFDASVRIEHRRYTIDLWGRNIGDKRHTVFYFESIGNRFVQYGKPQRFGITLSIHIQ